MAHYPRRSRWFWVRWTLLVASVGVAVAVCFILHHLDEIVHQKALEAARQKFPQAEVFIRSAHILKGEGIELSRFILLANPDANSVPRSTADAAWQDGNDGNTPNQGETAGQTGDVNTTTESTPDEEDSRGYPAVLEADRVLIECPTQLTDLQNDFEIRKIALDGATIRTYRRPDGSWSLAALKMCSSDSPTPSRTVIQLRNSVLEVHDMMDSQTERKLILQNTTMTITPEFQNKNDLRASSFYFKGQADCEFSHDIAFSGRFYPQDGHIEVDADFELLYFSDRLIQQLPLEIAGRLEHFHSLVGAVNAQLRVRTKIGDLANTQFFLKGKLMDGKAEDPRLHQAVTEMTADFQVGNGGFVVPNLKFKYGAGTAFLSMTQWGYGPHAPRTIKTNIRNVNLLESAQLSSQPNLQSLLNQIQASGQIDMDGEFHFDGNYWRATGDVTCREVSLQYSKFPYRLENLNGRIKLSGDSVAFQFESAQRQITLNGQIPLASRQNPQVKQQGTLNIQAQRLPVDEQLLAACPKKTAEFLRSLELGGAVNIHALQTFVMGEPNSLDSHIHIELLKNTLRYQKFPYPIREIEGFINLHNGQLMAQNLHGTNNQANVTISCSAQFPFGAAKSKTSDASKESFELFVAGTNVFLDEDFYSHLPQGVTSLFHYIRPQGSVQVQYHYKAEPERKPQVELTVDTPESGIALEFPTVSYRLEHFQGQFHYANGQFSLPQFQAVHETSRFSGRLSGSVTSPQQWQYQLEDLCVDSIPLDQEFLSLLPSKLRVNIASRRPEGLLHYHGALKVCCDGVTRPKHPIITSWDGEFGLTQAAFDCGVRLTHITGGIQEQGSWDGETLVHMGYMQVDSMFYKNVQFTNVHGPIWVDRSQLLLGDIAQRQINHHLANVQNATNMGSPPPQTQPLNPTLPNQVAPNQTPQNQPLQNHQSTPNVVASSVQNPFCAKTLDGDLLVNFALHFGDPAMFYLTAMLTKAKLESCAGLTGNDQLKGDVTLALKLQGSDTSLYSLKGSGELFLDDANIYKLSSMMSLLKILSLKEVDQNGFSSGNAKFHIDGQHVYFDQLNFYGDAFSLFGKGEMNFKQQIQLVFYSTPGRGQQDIPVLSQLVHATGRQMMYITMRGPLRNPEIHKQPLPGLNMAIQQMEEDLLAPQVGNRATPLRNKTPGRR